MEEQLSDTFHNLKEGRTRVHTQGKKKSGWKDLEDKALVRLSWNTAQGTWLGIIQGADTGTDLAVTLGAGLKAMFDGVDLEEKRGICTIIISRHSRG